MCFSIFVGKEEEYLEICRISELINYMLFREIKFILKVGDEYYVVR